MASQFPREQQWSDREFCERYAKTWEIATTDVHYGWLSPGESQLQLLSEIDLKGAMVLDVGCGMGENLIALSRRGAIGCGIDISPHMIEMARTKSEEEWCSSTNPTFAIQDMREFSAFEDVRFNIILSVYSLEYLRSIVELRNVLFNLYNRLADDGILVACFSHPLQHYKHRDLWNDSALSGDDPGATLIYSFRDAVDTISEVGFQLQRVVEQATRNP